MLTEEELVIFDILTRPAPELSQGERAEVKKVTRELLTRLRQLLVINWRHSTLAILLETTILLFSKTFTLSKHRTISTETQLRQAAKEALEGDDHLRWRWKALELTRERGADAILELTVDGRRLVFEVEFKLSPSVREVVRLAERAGTRPGLLVAPSLSPLSTPVSRPPLLISRENPQYASFLNLILVSGPFGESTWALTN